MVLGIIDTVTNVVVHSRAFSHKKIARDISSVIDGIVLSYDEVYNTFQQNVLVVSTIDYIDVAMASPFIIPARKCIYYGVAEGLPVLTPQARSILEKCIVVVPSNFVKTCVERVGVKVHAVIPHAVNIPDPDLQFSMSLREKLLKDHGCRYIVGWLGANQYRKGLDIVLDLVEYLPREICLMLITGYGEVNIPEELPRNVIFMDTVFRIDNIANYINVFDVLLNTSRSEGFGLPVYEALALGKKVVIPSIPVFKEFLDNVLGVFFYDVSETPRYELYQNYMWMEYYEPASVENIVDKTIEALRSDNHPDAYLIRKRFSIDLYEGFKKWL